MTRQRVAILAALLIAPCCSTRAAAQAAVSAVPAVVAAPVVAFRRGESQVRQMPLEQRPNRLGHFYGNNVRRRQTGTIFVNRQRTDRPVARYFYLAR